MRLIVAAEITPNDDRSLVNGNFDIHLVELTKATSGDWIELSYPVISMYGSNSTGADDGTIYLATTNSAAITTATATSVSATAYTNFPTTGDPFWIKIGSEIMEVSSWVTNTLTVRRGAMGTTAATHENTQALFVMNVLVMGATTGYTCLNLTSRAKS